ncbi:MULTISPECIES: polysaccharide pyruvyl transferase family protein [unclassified Pseudoalteromonas]|uniref:polysaccharide pyruvyl transferase family protein n=1 Tax=unclassified Pseudoalteromonas TaxID=194690 RepID=UPI0025B288D3|nr:MULTISPECIES: polysaccharide pyruvyl transferase family protein [unclassified Pseudoalteromonas]MDN3379126.1 polysaccharide pyruvyl transferase family protein [Pseudoalteromonas sp. APC 3893]MDN3389220.1 polysaccharide pyruvyl transferase family protein [Pseudoalteromonas sp. APC 4017]
MIIEVIGIGSPNKGAELMLMSIQQKILSKYPDAKFVVEPSTEFLSRSNNNVYQKFWFTLRGYQLGGVGFLIPRKLREKFGIILDSEIDIILDASGFAYGDQWGSKKLKNRVTKYLPKWNKSGKKIIFLPQAFGPFEQAGFKTELQKIDKYAELIFARDKSSFNYLDKFISKNKNILRLSSDYTNLCLGKLPSNLLDRTLDVCFIPNAKMIEMNQNKTLESYANSFANMINFTIKQGRIPFLLLHEGKKDLDLALLINRLLDKPVDLLEYSDPLEIKGIIGKSNIVVSSRFHGLVSGLSQSKPCIATGWSHKYEMLMTDYECEEFLVDEESSVALEKLEKLFDENVYSTVQEKISKNSIIEKQKSESMWTQVFNEIDS